MIRSLVSMLGCTVITADGAVRRLRDVLFDDTRWVVRQFVVATGDWWTGRSTLVPPAAVAAVDLTGRVVTLLITEQELEGGPGLEEDCPVYRVRELAAGGSTMWVASPHAPVGYPTPVVPHVLSPWRDQELLSVLAHADPHCRSIRAVRRYRVDTGRERAGTVETMLAEDGTWRIPFLLVRRPGFRGRPLALIPTRSIRSISWENRSVVTTRTSAPRPTGGEQGTL